MTVKKRPKTLSHGRPPVRKEKERMSSKLSASIIRTHHRLNKGLAAAVKKGDHEAVQKLEHAIEKNGGLKQYQAASKQGQSKTRGGDSSKVLVQWLQESGSLTSKQADTATSTEPMKLLEIGALSTENEISKFPGKIKVTRIDLNSQGPGITKQDFMKRSLPTSRDDQFDIVSLSLVLNYVPDPAQRGEMLKRIPRFLDSQSASGVDQSTLPALFLVLPLPCVNNSRYLDEELLLAIMKNLGLEVRQSKMTNKLCYYLFQLVGKSSGHGTPKKTVRDGPSMNNFCIVVE